jgi:hypothetical protein
LKGRLPEFRCITPKPEADFVRDFNLAQGPVLSLRGHRGHKDRHLHTGQDLSRRELASPEEIQSGQVRLANGTYLAREQMRDRFPKKRLT